MAPANDPDPSGDAPNWQENEKPQPKLGFSLRCPLRDSNPGHSDSRLVRGNAAHVRDGGKRGGQMTILCSLLSVFR